MFYTVQEFVAGKWFTLRICDTELEAREWMRRLRGKLRILHNGKKVA